MKVLLGPQEVAGQTATLARALRSLGVDATSVSWVNPRQFSVDRAFAGQPIPAKGYSRMWKQLYLGARMSSYLFRPDINVYHFRMMKTLFGDKHFDLPVLRLLGKKVLMEICGEEARIPEIAAANNPYLRALYQREKDLYFYTRYGGESRNVIAHIQQVARHIRVATSDYELYDYVSPYFERVEIVRQPVDTVALKPIYPSADCAEPQVVHLPSQRASKGTDVIERVVASLQERGLRFKFATSGRVLTHPEALQIMGGADIVIDQLVYGAHGGQAVEAMALGKPTVCYIREDLVARYPKELPLINANPDTIEERLAQLIVDGKLRREVGIKSRAYAEKYHDSVIIARQLVDIYQSL